MSQRAETLQAKQKKVWAFVPLTQFENITVDEKRQRFQALNHGMK